MAKALRLNRPPDNFAGVLRAIANSETIDDVVLGGEVAVYGYENELAAQKPRGDASGPRDGPPSPSGEGRLVGLVQLVRNSPYGQP